MSIQAGIYKGRGIAGSEQYGQSKNEHDQIVIDLDLGDGLTVSTFLIFSDKSAPYSINRLRALGWEGSDLTNLAGIDRNEVDVEVKYEEYEGEQKMRVQILTGGSVVLDRPMDDKGKRAFAARFKSLASTSTTSRQSSANPPRQPAGKAPAAGDADSDFPFGANESRKAAGVKL